MTDSERASRTRKTIIDIARRRQRPGTGSDVRALMEMPPRMLWPDLRDVLAGIPWAVAGAVATRTYMPERATSDLDIVVLPRDAAAVAERLRGHGFVFEGPLSIGGGRWRSPDGVPVDVLEGKEPWWKDALREAALGTDVQGFPVLSLPYLTLMKVSSSRAQDVADVTRMLGVADEATLDAVRDLFALHAPDLSEDLESLIQLGKLEMEG